MIKEFETILHLASPCSKIQDMALARDRNGVPMLEARTLYRLHRRLLGMVFSFAFGSLLVVSCSQANDQDRDAVGVLSQHCTRCHGPEKQEAGLRLDNADSSRLGGDSGPAFVANDSQKSILIHYVRGDGDTVMPPEGPRLTSVQVQRLADWIDRGAKWPQEENLSNGVTNKASHWSFQPILRPTLPPVRRTDWGINEIDTFILARLEREKLSPAPEADRRTLIRRLSLDLLGIPPADDDIDAFLADNQPDAYETLVDRYLAAPQFGERWARHWLDRTQYAESSGCVIDLPRSYAWRWRDWVVAAMNCDMPFDQFTIEQLSGDLPPNATEETRIATGFFRNALTNHEAGIELRAEQVKTTVDRTSMVGATWLGLTLGCAECHSHKYDPISQRDFYRMYAFFDRLNDQDIDSSTPDATHCILEARSQLERVRAAYIASPATGQLAWETRIKSLSDVWQVPTTVDPRTLRSLGFAMVHHQADGSLSVDGRLRSSDDHYVIFEPGLSKIRAVRVELLPDADRFHQGPGRCKDGECILSGISLSTSPVNRPNEIRSAQIVSVDADYCKASFDPMDAIKEPEKEETKGWAVDHKGSPHAAVFVLDSPLECDQANVMIKLHFLTGLGRNPCRFRVSVTDVEREHLVGQSVPSEIRQWLAKNDHDRTDDEKASIKRYYQSIHQPNDEGLKEWNGALDLHAQWTNPRGAECVQETWQPRETCVHVRGDFRRQGVRVEPGIPAAFESSNPSQANWTRLDLAHWIASPTNPLTSRVTVNSFWQSLFGAGLVRSAGDFGRQGEAPSHPELLDWLADEFMSNGWSRKATIRQIVCSATYRQSSTALESTQRDPQNLLLARQNRFRLDAEAVRDCLLDRSGLLISQLGGPSYRIPGPNDETTEDWEPVALVASSAGLFRRGLYVAIPRTLPDAMLTTFDAPDGITTCPLRQRTNTPLQAMTLLNDPLFVQAAKALSKSYSEKANESQRQRIEQMWRHCIGRRPTMQEIEVLEELCRELVAAQSSEGTGETDFSKVWFVLARTILNLDETVTRE